MQIYKAPVREMRFLLDAFGYREISAIEHFAAYDLDTVEALLRETASFAEEVLLPINRSGDRQGLRWDPASGAVTTPEGFKDAYAKMVENGFIGMVGPSEFGGGAAPVTVATLMSEMWTAGNKSLSMCPGLIAGLVEALHHHASPELKQQYLPKLVTGEWSGTMCLTEPQCGTDLGLCTTKAEPFGDHHKLTGTKIWITFGEHDLTENVLHLVLARLPDAPPGIKGISTFLVPKITLAGARNGIKCSGLEHKMGIHASPTCVMSLDGAEGWLVGEPHRGMKAMFTMMNGARLAVGNEGVALGEIAYQTALAFARDRRQSRALDPDKREPGAAADNILVHPDVRRMLLNIKSTTEGMRGLVCWTAMQLDRGLHHADPKEREQALDLLALLTPVVKGFCTERGFANVSEAMQVCGGAGFTVDWSIEQYLRDVRIAMIYEGTNHIQALDLVGRKLPMNGGRAFDVFRREVSRVCEEAKADAELRPLAEPVERALATLLATTGDLAQRAMADAEEAGAAASNYLTMFGLVATGYSWLRQCRHALTSGDATKLKTARYYCARILPEIDALATIVKSGKGPIMEIGADEL